MNWSSKNLKKKSFEQIFLMIGFKVSIVKDSLGWRGFNRGWSYMV